MHLMAAETVRTEQMVSMPEATIFVGLLITLLFLIGAAIVAFVVLRKTRIVAGQEDQLRHLVERYERLAENTLDAQQRMAADVSDLRSRTAAVEQILRTVE